MKKEGKAIKEMSVEYLITDEQAERLEKLVEAYAKKGLKNTTPEKVFQLIMITGASHEIDKKLSMEEAVLK